MNIYIPTYQRANIIRTHKKFSDELLKKVHLVIQPQEYEDYKKFEDKMKIVMLPEGLKYYAPAFYWILKHAIANGEEKMMILDDDLDFAVRRVPGDYHIKPCTTEEIDELFDLIEDKLGEYAHVSVSPREGNNRVTEEFGYNMRYMRVLGYNLKYFKDYKFDRYPHTLTDFDTALQLLVKGHTSCVIYKYANGQGGSNAKGGCSTHRTMQVQAEACDILKSHFPDFVNVVTKKTKVAWGGQERKDVIIAWKKAFESSKVQK